MAFYKVLNEDGSCYHGGNGAWPLPTQNEEGTWTPGEWMPSIAGKLVPCSHGYHVVELEQLLSWIGPAMFEVEVADCEKLQEHDKWVVRGPCRLVRRIPIGEREWRLFACECAERVVHLCGDDSRPARAIEVARRYANGESTQEELAAAWDAARAATRDAARAAARDTTRDAARAAAGDAWVAAWDAWVAAWDAWVAAWAAAGDAARAAAWAAARAAARAAAWAAASDAAWAAAWDAERSWQTARLQEYLEGKR